MNVSKKTYTISHSEKTTITIGDNALKELGSLLASYNHSGYFIVVDNTTKKLFLDTIVALLNSLSIPIYIYALPQGEQGKTIQELTNIFTNMLTNNVDRKGAVIALGGGVVGDAATLAAGLYLRGIDCIQIPTTLLAQVDSSIGGKGAVNMGNYKNMIGLIRQPLLIVSDTTLLKSLPKRQLRSGMGEVLKYAIGFDKDLFRLLKDNDYQSLDLVDIVKRCVNIKMKVVKEDSLDTSNIRAKVNFGHTLGHAIELSAKLLHGEAIAIGMTFAIKLSQKLSLLSSSIAEDAIDLIKQYELPISIKNVNKTEVIDMISRDKKAVKGNVSFMLLEDIGKTIVQSNIAQTVIEQTLSEVLL